VAEPKTTKTDASVAEFLATVADERRRSDAQALCALMTEVTGVQPAMWGPSIVGFGSYKYEYGSGRRGEWLTVGLSPRKQNLTLYLAAGIDRFPELLGRLGKHTTGKGCLYLKRLSDVDLDVLRQLVGEAFTGLDGRTIAPGQG
jgi:hypothetical protein